MTFVSCQSTLFLFTKLSEDVRLIRYKNRKFSVPLTNFVSLHSFESINEILSLEGVLTVQRIGHYFKIEHIPCLRDL